MTILFIVAAATLGCQGGPAMSTQEHPTSQKSIYDFNMRDIDGKATPLKKFKGEVLLIVNVASKCGNTPQYAQLQKLYTEKHEKGFEVLGFPANEFGHQEPGSDQQIKSFCTANYGVTFPLFSKIVVKGEGIHPLYQWLLNSQENHEDIDWNFAKFLVGRDGKVVKRFPASMRPDNPEIVTAIDTALSVKAG